MVRTKVAAATLLVLAAIGSGCAIRQTYPGERRPLPEVAILATAHRSEMSGSEEIHLETINGASELGDWSSLFIKAELLPGDYRIGVKYVSSVNPAFGVASLVADDVLAKQNASTARTLLLRMEPGRTCVVYVIREPLGYRVWSMPAARDYPERDHYPEWDPPADAVPCVPTAEGPLVLRCDPPLAEP